MTRTHASLVHDPEDRIPAGLPPLRDLVDWHAIIAGGVIAAGMSFLLLSFGTALGLALASPFTSEGASAGTIGIMAVLWFAFTQGTSEQPLEHGTLASLIRGGR